MKAGITEKGGVLLGDNIVCDGHAERRYRVVTHIHADHLLGLKKSLDSCEGVLMTAATKDILAVLKGPLENGNVVSLKYSEPLHLTGEQITLYDAGHVIGSAQVLVEKEDGTRLMYTGDFRLPEAEVIPADVLVIEATYGNPVHSRPSRVKIEECLVSLVRNSLEEGKHVEIYGYHGKLQEALSILRAGGVDEPAVMSERIYRVSEIAERNGGKLGRYFSSRNGEGREISSNGSGFISLHHMGARKKSAGGGTRILLSGWQFDSPVVKRGSNEFIIALSSHSDFNGLIEYVERSQPRVVITDNYRVENAGSLAREITRRLGVPAFSMPY